MITPEDYYKQLVHDAYTHSSTLWDILAVAGDFYSENQIPPPKWLSDAFDEIDIIHDKLLEWNRKYEDAQS